MKYRVLFDGKDNFTADRFDTIAEAKIFELQFKYWKEHTTIEGIMSVGDLAIAYFPCRVETTSDAIAIIDNMSQHHAYIQQYGDVEVVYDSRNTLWKVPSFSNQIKTYTAAKARDCAKWGSE